MNKFILGIIATLLFSTVSYGQNQSRTAMCNADCLFNDCAVSCPAGTNPRCSCIIGSFSSCKCIGLASRGVQQKITLKNEVLMEEVLSYLEKNKLYDFKQLYQELFNDLKKNNTASFEANFEKLDRLAISKPTDTEKIQTFVTSLKR